MNKVGAISLFFVGFSILGSAASACSYKNNVRAQLPKYMYGLASCQRTSCLKVITNGSRIQVNSGRYKLIYTPSREAKLNSVVLGQITRVGSNYDAERISVNRAKINIACTGNNKNRRTNHKELSTYAATIKYEDYDKWHRYGEPSHGSPFEELAGQLHFQFDNGASCVATGFDGRRVRFLFERRNEIPLKIAKLFRALQPAPQIAGDAVAGGLPARELQTVAYQLDRSKEVCVKIPFEVRNGDSVHISIDDIENRKPSTFSGFEGVLERFIFVSSIN